MHKNKDLKRNHGNISRQPELAEKYVLHTLEISHSKGKAGVEVFRFIRNLEQLAMSKVKLAMSKV